MIHTFRVKGMHCQSCASKISEALRSIPEVTKAEVSLDPPEATVEMLSHLPLSRLNDEIKIAGNYSLEEKETESNVTAAASPPPVEQPQSLTPLFIILGYILGGVYLRAEISGDFSLHTLMENFMGGFFVLFSLFKMINLSGFADAYSTYDILAKRSRLYALAYPFIELLLGAAYLTGIAPLITNLVTVALMAVGSIGVAQALLKKGVFQCACLGTALNLPMTKVTLAEDVVMGAMAAVMLMSAI